MRDKEKLGFILKSVANYCSKIDLGNMRIMSRFANSILIKTMFKCPQLAFYEALIKDLYLENDKSSEYKFHFDDFKETFIRYQKYIHSINLGAITRLAFKENIFESFTSINKISIEKCKLEEVWLARSLEQLHNLRVLSLKNLIITNSLTQWYPEVLFRQDIYKLDTVLISQVDLKPNISKLRNYFDSCKYIITLYSSNLVYRHILEPFTVDKGLQIISFCFNNSFKPIEILQRILNTNPSITQIIFALQHINQENINLITSGLPNLEVFSIKALPKNEKYPNQILVEPNIVWTNSMKIKKLNLGYSQVSENLLNNILSKLSLLEELEITLGSEICKLASVLNKNCPKIKNLVICYIDKKISQDPEKDAISELFHPSYIDMPFLCTNNLKSLTLINMDVVKFVRLCINQFISLDVFNFKQDFQKELSEDCKKEIKCLFRSKNYRFFENVFKYKQLIGYIAKPQAEVKAYSFKESNQKFSI
jgi:hypothetical protein